jgi:hypothetical protein
MICRTSGGRTSQAQQITFEMQNQKSNQKKHQRKYNFFELQNTFFFPSF